MSPTIYFPIIFFVVGYFLGAIPFAVIVAKRFGVDIFKVGSGNPGATNVKRVCGKKAGNTVFFLDALKGFVAAFLPIVVFGFVAESVEFGNDGARETALAISQFCGLAGAVAGHCFSCFLKFKGGKGVSATIGALLGAMPVAVLLALVVWVIFYFWSRIVAIASIAFGIFLPCAAFLLIKFAPALGYGFVHFWFCCAIMIFIIVMHHSNIRRLIRGEENSFAKKK
ncbi:MAG: glycerol-3-phosphate 1-O-acyltransferase PlsY [Opitutae bacterium]|nr:glycerol-3-phosphate 1-O-acyltransferase PlsY [Opitutae bacterium]MCD8299119.1 glycerol-3-phosphate 1-O-acyltransferase PlsY [Opitutae bacterium]